MAWQHERREDDWEGLKQRIRTRWPALSEDELEATGGAHEALMGLLQSHLGYAQENARRDLEEVLRGRNIPPRDVADEDTHTGTSGPVPNTQVGSGTTSFPSRASEERAAHGTPEPVVPERWGEQWTAGQEGQGTRQEQGFQPGQAFPRPQQQAYEPPAYQQAGGGEAYRMGGEGRPGETAPSGLPEMHERARSMLPLAVAATAALVALVSFGAVMMMRRRARRGRLRRVMAAPAMAAGAAAQLRPRLPEIPDIPAMAAMPSMPAVPGMRRERRMPRMSRMRRGIRGMIASRVC